MLWQADRADDLVAKPPAGYVIEPSAPDAAARALVEAEGRLAPAAWEDFVDHILPAGLFVVRDLATGRGIGTASALHNPRGGRYYFPFGGELGYLWVTEAHRARGLGASLVSAAVARIWNAGYPTIRVGVQGWRLPAIRCYLRVGFVPLLHAPELAARWQRIFVTLDLLAVPAAWPTGVSSDGSPLP